MGREGYQSLQTFQGIAQVDPSEDFGEWNGKQSVRTFHIFVNQTEEPVDLVWFYEGSENYSGTILPGSNLYVGKPYATACMPQPMHSTWQHQVGRSQPAGACGVVQ